MRLLTRYILREVFYYFGLFAMVFAAVLLVYEGFDTREEIIGASSNFGAIVLFLIFSLPDQMSQALPLMGLLATLMAFGMLAKNNELLAMIAAGSSWRQLAGPVAVFGVFLCVFGFWFNDRVAPESRAHARYIEKVELGGQSASVLTERRKVFVKGIGRRFYFMQEYLPDRREMIYPTILELTDDANGVKERIEAERAKLVVDAAGKSEWELDGAEQWTFGARGEIASYRRHDAPFRTAMEEDLEKFLGNKRTPKEMQLSELNEYLALAKRRGDADATEFSIAKQRILAFPIACLLMAVLGFTASAGITGGHFARGVAIGLVIALSYYVVEATLTSVAANGTLGPIAAVWGAMGAFALVIAVLMHRLEARG